MTTPTQSYRFNERHHALAIDAGLYFLRYASSASATNFPRISIKQHPENRDIILLSQPGCSDTELEAPGDYVVVRANVPGTLNFVVAAADRNAANAKIEVRLERIAGSQARAAEKARTVSASTRSASVSQDDISILAHVSRRGDVLARPGEWICGPDLPLPIEGVEIRWPNRPAGVELLASAKCNRAGREFRGKTGQFAGTRGKAASLTGFDLSLNGNAGADYELRAEALFLGAAVLAQRGRQISFAGPTGREPLVGLRIDVVRSIADPLQINGGTAASRPAPQNKVRVYRSAPVAT